MKQRVVFNALALRPGGSGVQTYIRELLRALPHVANANWCALVQSDAADGLPEAIERILLPQSDGIMRGLNGLRPVGDADLLHGLNTALPMRIKRYPQVATVHDLAFFDVPWASSSLRRRLAKLQVASTIRRADVIIANSAFTAQRVRDRFGRDAVPVPLAAPAGMKPATQSEVARVRSTYKLPEQFVLHVGNIEPRKDIPTLATACRAVGVPLVLAGAKTAAAGVPPEAVALGYVRAADLAALYGSATLVAYVSRYEGFGLPALEAIACGAPLIASDIPPHRENLVDAAELVPPGQPELLAGRIRSLVSDEQRRAELAAAGLRRSHNFSWRKTAAATAAVYRSMGITC